MVTLTIVALRNEKGSYNKIRIFNAFLSIVALRNEKGSYNQALQTCYPRLYCSTAK